MGGCQSSSSAKAPVAAVPPDPSVSSSKATSIQHSDSSTKSAAESTAKARQKNFAKSYGRHSSLLDSCHDDRKALNDLKSNFVHLESFEGRPIESVYDGVKDGRTLGDGISGTVRLCTHKQTGCKYAVKSVPIDNVVSDHGLQALKEEIMIMSQLDHPNIVRLEEVYESHSHFYLVEELCLGGELFDRLDEQPDYHYGEAECAKLVKQMLSAVQYIHEQGIVHRDLKLENFLFESVHADSELVMIDFGLSKHFIEGDVLHESVGTPYAVAPEVISGNYDAKCDVWAIGVIAFLLLSGELPFGGCDPDEDLLTVRKAILSGRFEYEPQELWTGVSQHAKDFIHSLLVVDPSLRPTAHDALQHEWFHDWDTRENQKLDPKVIDSLVSFKEMSSMKKLLCQVLSFTLLPEQIHSLHKEFEKLDKDGDAQLTEEELREVLMSKQFGDKRLSEEEFQEIFEALKINKEDKCIHWHEFIAAELSQCSVDNRNLRLAFDHLDTDHTGYVTFENLVEMMGKDAHQLPALRKMWKSSLQDCHCQTEQITFDDFTRLMGQADTTVIFVASYAHGLNRMECVREISFSLGVNVS